MLPDWVLLVMIVMMSGLWSRLGVGGGWRTSSVEVVVRTGGWGGVREEAASSSPGSAKPLTHLQPATGTSSIMVNLLTLLIMAPST